MTTGNVFRNVNGTIHLTIGTAGYLLSTSKAAIDLLHRSTDSRVVCWQTLNKNRAFSDEAWVEPSPVWSAKHIGTFEDVAYGYGSLYQALIPFQAPDR